MNPYMDLPDEVGMCVVEWLTFGETVKARRAFKRCSIPLKRRGDFGSNLSAVSPTSQSQSSRVEGF